MKTSIVLLLSCIGVSSVALNSHASELPFLPSHNDKSPHKLFLHSETENADYRFDVWHVEGGYSYNVFDSIDLYVGARVNNSEHYSSGFLSGVSYQLNDKIMFKSTLHSFKTEDDSLYLNKDVDVISAEVSSRVQLSENLDIHATLDYQEWQQGVEVGIGFRF